MKKINYKNKFSLLILFYIICNFTYSQNGNNIFSEFYEKEYQKELIFIKDFSLKKKLESIINEKNYCVNNNLIWYLKNEKNKYLIITLVKRNSIWNENLKYITIINDFTVYTNEIEKLVKFEKSYIYFKYEQNEDIIFQDFSYWVIIKENDEYIIKKEFINCK